MKNTRKPREKRINNLKSIDVDYVYQWFSEKIMNIINEFDD